jgi:aspartate-semialdehyde dehydrogenase
MSAHVAIIGATGAVGREMLTTLEQRAFPVGRVRLFASPRSAGAVIPFRGQSLAVEALTEDSFDGVDLALFSAGAATARRFAPIAAAAGATVVDNSSAFRMDPAVPLLIPDVNPGAAALAARQPTPGRIYAVPNCSAIILLVALTPLRSAFGIDRIVVSTYQAASGAGARAMRELTDQTRAFLEGRPVEPGLGRGGVFHEPYAFNLFSHNAPVDPATGLNGEEQKIIAESRRIWNDPALRIAPTCVRVPVLRAHTESVNVTLRTPATEREVREALAAAPGVRVVDDRAANQFPTPLKAAGGDEVLVGRIRPDPSQPQDAGRTTGFDLLIAGDQLRVGAALTAVRIAELACTPAARVAPDR